MKIYLINNLYRPYNVGGAESVVEMQEEGLRKAGHDVFIITTKPDGKLERDENIYRFKPMNLFYYKKLCKRNVVLKILWHIVDMFNLHSYYQVEKILKKESPDLVITHNLMGIGFLIPLLIKVLGIRHIHLLHDVQLVVPSGLIIKGQEDNFLVNGLPTKIYGQFCKWLFGSPSRVVSPSKWLMNFYIDRGFFKSSAKNIIKNPIRDDGFKKIKTERTKNYLFVGQLEKHKGIDWLVKFWDKEKVPNKLFVVGDGSLKYDDKNNIEFLGRRTGEELNDIFDKADFLIMPSLCYENSPTVIPLAYQNGTPVICADIGGAGELVEEGKTGYLFEAGSEDDFSDKLRLVNNLSTEQYIQMIESCGSELDKFNLNQYIEEILSL